MQPDQSRFLLLILAGFSALALSACASIDVNRIAAKDLSPSHKHPYTVHVRVDHYADQKHIKDYGLSPAVIIEATRLSIESSKLFKAVVPANEADYILSMRINAIHPKFQMGPTVWYMSHINWKLTETKTNRVPYARNILYAKAVTAAARGRGVTAQEGAFHGNVRQALWDLGTFDIATEVRPFHDFKRDRNDPE